MMQVKYLILGAGPSGLTFANMLLRRGETSFLVIEKEDTVGGLCRSVTVDGAPFDIGGGHFLDVRRPEVTSFLFEFMPEEEWNIFDRDSRIELTTSDGVFEVSHPLEANIWQLPEDVQEKYLSSIKVAGCNNNELMPDRFIPWITWKLGDKIAADYMLPYNRKMFADELNELGTYWLEKLPNVDYEDTLRSCREHRAYGSQPGHASFYYPKEYGYGEVWLRMGQALGDKLVTSVAVSELNITKRSVKLSDGTKITADAIISTVPWNSYSKISGLTEGMVDSLYSLKHSSIETRYVSDNLDTKAQWIYIPDGNKPYHRILVRHNFAPNSRGYWLETRKERCDEYNDDSYSHMNEYAYPLNTLDKPRIVDRLLNECKVNHVYGLGRWGEHSHYNSDLVVSRAMELADSI